MKIEAWKRKQTRLQAKVDKAYSALHEHEKTCPHPNLKYKHEGSTGHWDRSDDSYWTVWDCDCCNKRWTTDQNGVEEKALLAEFPHAKDITYERYR